VGFKTGFSVVPMVKAIECFIFKSWENFFVIVLSLKTEWCLTAWMVRLPTRRGFKRDNAHHPRGDDGKRFKKYLERVWWGSNTILLD